MPKRGAGTAVDVVCRGVTSAAFALRPEVRIVSGRTLVTSVLVEATALALAGGILGAAIVYAVLDGYTASTFNPAAGSQLAFAFRVTPESMRLGLGWAIALGVIGGSARAMRAARLPIPAVLREA